MTKTKSLKMKTDFSIEERMAELLNPGVIQKEAKLQSIEEAIVNLNKAADILDNMGLFVAAEAVTQVMESLPESLEEKK